MGEVIPEGFGLLDEGEDDVDPEEAYEILEKLGEGSYGSVWKARHKETGIVCALKHVIAEPEDLEGVLKEIGFMKELISPYIVRYLGSYVKGNNLWIAMEYCSVGSAQDCMRLLKSTLTEDVIAELLKGAIEGLIYLHERKKIHRDIKSGNILIAKDGTPKLADFGVSGQLSDANAKRMTVVGTPFWMAPEIIQEVGYDVKADVWSLGITAIEMAQGEPPLANIHPMRAIFKISNSPPPKMKNPEEWSDELNDFVASCLVKDPVKRPTAAQMLQHPFITNAKGRAILQDLVEEVMGIIETEGRVLSEEEEEEEESGSGESGSESGSEEEEEEEDMDYTGTMVVVDGPRGEISGTMVVEKEESKEDYTPAFMVGRT